MKTKKITSIALSAVMALSGIALLASCEKNKPIDGTDSSPVVTLKTTAPICFTASSYTDASLSSSTFTVEYDASYNLAASIADESLASIEEVSKTTEGDVVTATYRVDSNGIVGVSTVDFSDSKGVVDSVPVSVKTAYPETGFNNLTYSSDNNGAAYSHDPTIIEVKEGYTVGDKTYYYFSYSTDNEGGYGVPVRGSVDMIEWDHLGTAIPDFGGDAAEVKEKCLAGTSELQDVYDVLSSNSNWASVWTLWAAEVVPAANGGYWLYGSWTDAFGSRRSVIFQCYSDSPVGPFKYTDMIVYSPNTRNDSKQSNAIDPSIYYDLDGNMYMSYGSFSDFRVIELNPETGLRKDGKSFTVEEMKASSNFYVDDEEQYDASDYFGTKILSNTNIEGSVINYYTVPVYTGDIAAEEYDESKIVYESNYYLMGSANSLSANYNMRVFKSSTAAGEYTSAFGGNNGNLISGSFTWVEKGDNYTNTYALNHFVPGHNDLITTSTGENFIAYHNKVAGSEGAFGTQFLYVGLVAFNSNGDLIMSPNRYNGESLRKVTADEITKYSGGNYLGATISSNKISDLNYPSKYTLNADGTIGGAGSGTWKLYGDNYVYIVLDGFAYYGVVMPSYCMQADSTAKRGYTGKGGLAISAVGYQDGEQKVLFMQMNF